MAQDFDAILATIETQKGPQCTVCRLLDELEGDPNRDKVVAALNSDRMQAHLARAFAALTGDPRWSSRGQTIANHRRQHMSAA